MKAKIISICFWALLLAFTIYVALDTFVIPKTYAANVSQNSTVMFDNTSTSVSSGSNRDGIIIAAHNSGETSDEAADDNTNEASEP